MSLVLDGKVAKEELRRLLQNPTLGFNLDMDDAAMAERFGAIDKDESGMIEFD